MFGRHEFLAAFHDRRNWQFGDPQGVSERPVPWSRGLWSLNRAEKNRIRNPLHWLRQVMTSFSQCTSIQTPVYRKYLSPAGLFKLYTQFVNRGYPWFTTCESQPTEFTLTFRCRVGQKSQGRLLVHNIIQYFGTILHKPSSAAQYLTYP